MTKISYLVILILFTLNVSSQNGSITGKVTDGKELLDFVTVFIENSSFGATTDIEGNLVAEAQSNVNLRYKGYNLEIDGGTAYWNGKNLANNTVASGVYVVLFSDFDSFETKVSKIMIIR